MQNKLHQNLGPKDRIVRSIVGAYLLATAASTNMALWGAAIFAVLGTGLLLEALSGY